MKFICEWNDYNEYGILDIPKVDYGYHRGNSKIGEPIYEPTDEPIDEPVKKPEDIIHCL